MHCDIAFTLMQALKTNSHDHLHCSWVHYHMRRSRLVLDACRYLKDAVHDF